MNEKLSGISRLYEDKLVGPEGLVYYNNSLYTTVHYGHVLKLEPDENKITPVVKFGKVCDGLYEEHICGRPLGITAYKGFLYVTDAYYGVYKVNINSPEQYGAKEQIVSIDEVIDGAKPKVPNSVIVTSDGIIYWTDSDTNYALHDGLYTVFVDGTGRLIKYDPKTKQNTVLVKNIHFANGISLSEDESFIIISETSKYRLLKYYLKGPNEGKSEVFVDGLPGMPDNIKKIGNNFYVSLVFSRIPVLDIIVKYPTVRMVITKFMGSIDLMFQKIDSFYPNIYCKKAAHLIGHFESVSFIKSIITPHLTILKINEKGTILSSWSSTDGKVSGISDIEVIGDKLYLGSPFNKFLGVRKLPHGFL